MWIILMKFGGNLFSFSGNILYCVRLFPPAVCNAGADRIFINTACSAGYPFAYSESLGGVILIA